MRDGTWTTVAESQRSGLLYLKERLPDTEPYRAWSSFIFTAHRGHVREVATRSRTCPSGHGWTP